ncbi:MAG: hypothetical protein QOF37_677 [Thermoleophilaceae bacterium]|nr:hypothetical protein [Thermoleophilaceae bacterium]
MTTPRDEIEQLVAFEGRGPGTDAERRAANHLRGRVEALGRSATVEPTWIRPNWPLAYTAYALFGVVASIASIGSPVAGAIVAGVALVAALGDLSGRVHTGRLLTGRRGSQNVISPEESARPGTLVLVAHYDAGRTGFVFGRLAALGRRIGPFRPIVVSLALVLATAALRAGGGGTPAVEIVQFAATVVLILAVPAFADIALSGVVPGASGNASGVSTVLRLAERYGGDLEHFDVWVLLTGGEEAFGAGMREWVRRHRAELDPARTVFLNVDTVGSGTVRYTRREGALVPTRHHPRLVELCDQIAQEDAEERRYGARPITIRSPGDSAAVRRAGFPAITISCREPGGHAANLRRHTDVPAAVDDAALDRAFGFCSELIELIDEAIGPDVSDHAAQEGSNRLSGLSSGV